ncbi:MAG: ThiF family adenylyltransferase [Candidatus Hodarchaeota archaeon]
MALYCIQAEIDEVNYALMAISGLAGVGAITAALRAPWGVKRFRLLDMGRYSYSNRNRQLFATPNTLGRWNRELAAYWFVK